MRRFDLLDALARTNVLYILDILEFKRTRPNCKTKANHSLKMCMWNGKLYSSRLLPFKNRRLWTQGRGTLVGKSISCFLNCWLTYFRLTENVHTSGQAQQKGWGFWASHYVCHGFCCFLFFFYVFAPPTPTLVATGKNPTRREGTFPHLEKEHHVCIMPLETCTFKIHVCVSLVRLLASQMCNSKKIMAIDLDLQTILKKRINIACVCLFACRAASVHRQIYKCNVQTSACAYLIAVEIAPRSSSDLRWVRWHDGI